MNPGNLLHNHSYYLIFGSIGAVLICACSIVCCCVCIFWRTSPLNKLHQAWCRKNYRYMVSKEQDGEIIWTDKVSDTSV